MENARREAHYRFFSELLKDLGEDPSRDGLAKTPYRVVDSLEYLTSGYREDVVSNVGAVGVMQRLPETWNWVDVVLLGERTPRTADGNIQAGVRYLRWQLDQFGGNRRLALAGWYQGARAVRQIGLYDDTKQFVSIVLQLYGKV